MWNCSTLFLRGRKSDREPVGVPRRASEALEAASAPPPTNKGPKVRSWKDKVEENKKGGERGGGGGGGRGKKEMGK